MTYFKVRNDISVAALSRILNAMRDIREEEGLVIIPELKVYNVLDVRIVLFPDRYPEGYNALAEKVMKRCAGALPMGALKVMEED